MSKRAFGPYVFESSNEDKILFPGEGITKGNLMEYYARIAEVMLPHLRDRPLTMHRFPDGIQKEGFYHKQAQDYYPDWIRTVEVAKEGGTQDLIVADNAATLAWMANQACITPHVWLSRTGRLRRPDLLVLDLDPAGGAFAPVCAAALRCRELLERLGLKPFVKSSGSRGLHVTCPLDGGSDFDAVRALARDAAGLLAHRHPDDLTTEQRKEKRGRRLYLDVGRNAYAQTVAAPYAVRPRPGAPVAAPLTWREIENGRLTPRDLRLDNIFRRLGQRRDPWSGMARHARGLAPARRALARLRRDAGLDG